MATETSLTTETSTATETSLTIAVEHNGLTLTATLPEVFAALAEVLPIASKLFGSKKHMLVDSRMLHASLDTARNHSTWLSGVWKQYSLVEGVDFFVERLDKNDMSNWPAIKANGGKVPTVYLFPPKLAARIATMTKTEMGQKIWDYMYAVTDAAHDTVEAYYQKQIAQGNENLRLSKGAYLELDSKAKLIAEQLGFPGREQAFHQAQTVKANSVKREEAQTISQSGLQAQSLTMVIQTGAKYFKRVKANPVKVQEGVDELLNALSEIQNGNLNYYPAF